MKPPPIPQTRGKLHSSAAAPVSQHIPSHASKLSVAFVVKDAAGRWTKDVAFSDKCSFSLAEDTGGIIVRHHDHMDDPNWLFVFPIFSQVKRLLPCHRCLPDTDDTTSERRLCDSSFPCLACQHRRVTCVSHVEGLDVENVIDGDAEMQLAAEDAVVIHRSYTAWAVFSTDLEQNSSPAVYEGYIPKPVPSTPSASSPVQPLRPMHADRILRNPAVSSPESPSASRKPELVPSTAANAHALLLCLSPPGTTDLRRSTRLHGPKRKAEALPAHRPNKKLHIDDCVERLRKQACTRTPEASPIMGYSMQKDQPPPWVDLGGLELTMAEISVFLLNVAHRPEGATRLVDNGWTPHHFCSYHNWSRGYSGETRARGQKSEGAIRSTFTKIIQKIMRAVTGNPAWLQTYHKPAPTTDLSTASWSALVDHPPTHPLRSMGRDILHWPPEAHSLNLTRAVRFAVENPDITDDQLQFPIHVRSIVERLPGGFRSRAAEAAGPDDNLDQTILKHWKEYQEKTGTSL
ncbi:hypothetical protein GTA08_BOTSDO06304 [Botryosphaeria dothidea]|uniref:Uncharacterized protein n=1 Tax=Botryosphaeria dothidea TaxID=55169 RepID=A0A8H4N1K8_9PEZI|nr:hypothetical protein GTA08_BOTSDO10195 [Botryosphaeria dothidea]KAF4305575.1 hypothetical protein GTA08_BOTSDO06304 [Botryosphaeria dothidea]